MVRSGRGEALSYEYPVNCPCCEKSFVVDVYECITQDWIVTCPNCGKNSHLESDEREITISADETDLIWVYWLEAIEPQGTLTSHPIAICDNARKSAPKRHSEGSSQELS